MAKAHSRRGKKRSAPQQRKRRQRRPNLHIIGIASIFCAGILLGAYALNRVYTLSEDAATLAFAEQIAAERAQAEYEKRIREQAFQQKRLEAQQKKQRSQEKEAQQRLATNSLQASKPGTNKSGNTTTRTIKPSNTRLANTQGKPPTSQYVPKAGSTLVAIVIDDVGYKRDAGERTLALPAKATIAVLPYTPFAKSLALQAPGEGKEVMLHAPMEPKRLSYWGEGLRTDMSQNELRDEFRNMLDSIPNLVGVNNHMGSQFTENRTLMFGLMTELPARGLYFIDSRTTAESQGYGAALAAGVETYSRDVFLDHSRKPEAIAQQLERLIAAAKEQGMALGIGHPYPETLAVLEREIPKLRRQGIEFVTVSELLNAKKHRTRLALQETPP